MISVKDVQSRDFHCVLSAIVDRSTTTGEERKEISTCRSTCRTNTYKDELRCRLHLSLIETNDETIDIILISRHSYCLCIDSEHLRVKVSSLIFNVSRHHRFLLFIRIFGKDKKDEGKGQCSGYKKPCGPAIGTACCRAPYKCDRSTVVCGKGKMCCLSETDIQKHKQLAGQNWLAKHNG